MSTAQIQRLEGLLGRVQKNRLAARVEAPANVAATVVERAEVVAPAIEAPRPASPLEHAIESKAVAPVAAHAVVSLKPVPVGVPAVAKTAQPAPKPAPTPAAELVPARAIPAPKANVDPNVPARVVTSPAPPSAPIATVASPHPVMDGPSFGELLRRSLALRPR